MSGRAPIEGSDNRLLEATLRQDEPAPSPDTIKLAATRIVPAALLTPPPRNARLASVSTVGSISPQRGGALSYAAVSSSDDDSDRLLSGRGLY